MANTTFLERDAAAASWAIPQVAATPHECASRAAAWAPAVEEPQHEHRSEGEGY